MPDTSRDGDGRQTQALHDKTNPARRTAPQNQRYEQEQRDEKARDIDHRQRARHDATCNFIRVRQAKGSQHTKSRGRDDRAEEKRGAKPAGKQDYSGKVQNVSIPFLIKFLDDCQQPNRGRRQLRSWNVS